MRFIVPIALFFWFTDATPTPHLETAPVNAIDLKSRQNLGIIRTELENGSGPCPPVIFVYARGSNETGNMVSNITYIQLT